MAAAVAFWVFFDRQRAPEQQMDTALNAMPAWQVIKEQEPALHQRILDQMAALQKRASGQQIIDTIQPQILHLQMSRLQNAPDANVVNYMTINMEQTAAISEGERRRLLPLPLPDGEGRREPDAHAG
jgi:hypothetical protein